MRAATRGSELAMWQTAHVADLLGIDVEVVVVETEGDRRRDMPIWEVGGRGVFVKEVQTAVLDGRADFAVHSAKDLPSSLALAAPGLVLAAVPERGDPRDCLVGSTLDALAPGALVATGSVRRRAQLAWLRPDLTFTGLRGNVGTRLEKAAQYDAAVMPIVALNRLGRSGAAAEIFDPSVMLPQVGQGALAVECREGDGEVAAALAGIEDPDSRRAVDAERAFLGTLHGGCDLPVGAYATIDAGGAIHLEALVASRDGRVVMRDAASGHEPSEVGAALGSRLLAAAQSL